MARITKIVCDICGREKQQVNHWWMYDPDGNELLMFIWNDELDIENYSHACGQECITKMVSEWMSKQAEGAR